MFQFPTFPFICYFTYIWIIRLFPLIEFPHSDIHALTVICTYTWLFAACHVLLRLLMPRHSPYALSSLTLLSSKSISVNFLKLFTSLLLVYLLATINQKLLCQLLKNSSLYTNVLFLRIFIRFLVLFDFFSQYSSIYFSMCFLKLNTIASIQFWWS